MADSRYFVFCVECAKTVMDEDSKLYWAMFGPQGTDDDDAVLVCVPWRRRRPDIGHLCQQFACDGCGIIVSVAPSSQWFIERHKAQYV